MLLKFFVLALIMNLSVSNEDNFTFNGFQGANLSMDGSATISHDGLLMLTNESEYLKAHAFFPVPLRFKKSPVSEVGSFCTTFVFAIVPKYPTFGPCGFSFALSPTTNFSEAPVTNQFLGLFNSGNNGMSSNHILAVEFDTLFNADVKDIDNNHVGIDVNGAISIDSHTAGYCSDGSNQEFKNITLISGEPMQAWIEYDGFKMQLNVTLAPLKVPKPNLPLLSSTINLSSVLLDFMYVGFSLSTTFSFSYYYILGWSFSMAIEAEPLDLSRLPSLPPRNLGGDEKKPKHLTIWLPLVVSVTLLASLGAITLMVRKKNKFAELHDEWEIGYESHRVSYKDLYKATKGFKEKGLLGVGGFGQVYRGVMPKSLTQVAVKRISHGSGQGVKEFIAEIVSITGQFRHRNLVQLLGYCRRKGELLLVYDYMPNGSLDKFIFGREELTLNWCQRFGIIKGVASGLLYLHEDGEKVVIHRDIKAGNVLLDADINGRLGDFGLARLYEHGANPSTTHVMGTMGYLAPELSRTGKATTSTDVFAFGAFLLEVACGRRPIEPGKQAEEQNLVDWVFKNWRKGTILEASDPRLRSECVVEEMEMVLKLGLLCSSPMPAARPSMRQVTQILDGDVPLPELLPSYPIASGLASMEREGLDGFIMAYPSLAVASVQLRGQ